MSSARHRQRARRRCRPCCSPRPSTLKPTLLFSELLTPRYPVSIRSEGKQKASGRTPFICLKSLRDFREGEGIRTLYPNLGNSCYAASLGISRSTNRKNQVLRVPATDRLRPTRALASPSSGQFQLRGRDLNLRAANGNTRALGTRIASSAPTTAAANEAKKHHYVPQFYMRRFACADDENKVMVLERHCNVVVADRKSIEGIGYEERLHDYDDNGAPASIEGDLNKAIETPFSQNGTWLKISGGVPLQRY
jgi:hypothetical protein